MPFIVAAAVSAGVDGTEPADPVAVIVGVGVREGVTVRLALPQALTLDVGVGVAVPDAVGASAVADGYGSRHALASPAAFRARIE